MDRSGGLEKLSDGEEFQKILSKNSVERIAFDEGNELSALQKGSTPETPAAKVGAGKGGG